MWSLLQWLRSFFCWLTDSFLVTKITCVEAEILFKVAVMTSSVSNISSFVAKVTFVVAQITFKVASVANISLLVTKIPFVVAEIIIKEDVITSYVPQITYIVPEITMKMVVVTSSVAMSNAQIWTEKNKTFMWIKHTFLQGQLYVDYGENLAWLK